MNSYSSSHFIDADCHFVARSFLSIIKRPASNNNLDIVTTLWLVQLLRLVDL